MKAIDRLAVFDVYHTGCCTSKILAEKTSSAELYMPAHSKFRALENHEKAKQASKCEIS